MVDIHRWGPAAWTFLYAAAFKYPDDPTPEQREGATHFFRGLQVMLPCHECQQHYGQYQQEFPIEHNVGGRNQLCAWLLGLNNRVNANTGKPMVTLRDIWHDLVEEGPLRQSRYSAALVCVLICGLALGVALLYYWRCKA